MRQLPLALLFAATCAFAQTAAPVPAPSSADFDTVVNAYARDNRFIGSVLVAKDDAIVFEQSVGPANAEWNIPNSATTKFRLGSVTKQFTAAAILLLNEQGKLQLDDPLSKLLPAVPAAWGQVSVRQLLSHTSGVPSFTEAKEYTDWKLHAEGPAAIIAHIADKPLDFTPGEKFHYSNTGYVLLGWIVAQVSGESYEKFLHDAIFAPLAMTDSGYDSNTAVIPHRASGYAPGPHGFRNADYIDMHVPGGAGGLYSTTRDLLRWTQGLFGGKVLRPESLAQMTTPVQSHYGFGVVIGERRGHKIINHSGGIEGFSSYLAYFPDAKITVVVLSNLVSANADRLGTALGTMALGGKPTLPSAHTAITLPRASLERYVGTYQLSPTFAITVALAGDQLTAQGTGQPALPITPESPTRFFATGVDAVIEFFVENGTVTHLILDQAGHQSKGVKQP